MKLEQGKLVKWENAQKQQIIWMVTDEPNRGVVIHSDGLISIGTIMDLTVDEVTPFVGKVNISSTANQ